MKESRRIAYDGRLAIEPFRGMGRYLRTLISGRQDELLGFCASGESSKSLDMIGSGFSFYPAWEQLSLPRLISKFNIGTFIAPYNTGPLLLPSKVRLVLIVHDLIFLEPSPPSYSTYQNVGRIYRRLVVPRAIRKAEIVLTVSDFTKTRLVDSFGIDPEQIRVIPCSLGAEWFVGATPTDCRGQFIFMVSGEAPSKNLGRGIEAFAQFVQMTENRQFRLKIAGVKAKFHAVFAQLAEKLGIGSAVDFLGYVSDSDLRSLYRAADAFVMPSLSEGFGIPVLEAMASRVPVAASSGGSLPEVAGNAALYFDPYSIEDMAERMREILTTKTTRDALITAGDQQARKYHEKEIQPVIDSFWHSLGQP
jgi:glycosyltransferase involved in cell wall biosynthesis